MFDELTTIPSSCTEEFVETMVEMGVKEEFARAREEEEDVVRMGG